MTTAIVPGHRAPSWLHLVEMQLQLIFRSGRWIELPAGMLVLLAVAALENGLPPRGAHAVLAFILAWNPLLAALVALWPAFLWRGEKPSRRRYHWSLPVSRGAHDLARVVAGAAWLILAFGVMAIVQFLALRPFGVHWNSGWLAVYVLGLLTSYCLGSIAAVLVGKPALWFYGILVAWITVVVVSGWTRERSSGALARPLVGRYGYVTATMGASFRLIAYEGYWVAVSRNSPASADPVDTTRTPGPTRAIPVDADLPATRSPERCTSSRGLLCADTPAAVATASLVWLVPAMIVLLLTGVYRHERSTAGLTNSQAALRAR